MTLLYRGITGALVVAGVFAACKNGRDAVGPRESTSGSETAVYNPSDPMSTMGSGTTSTPLGRANFSDPHDQTFKVMRKTGDWDVDIKSKPGLEMAVQSIVFHPGGFSGWHSHPGPVFIEVVSGTMTFYKADDPACTPIVVTAPGSYLDVGDVAHIARNETSSDATNVVVYFAPPNTPQAGLKIDLPEAPFANCPAPLP
jgi:hypothetical protein